MGIKYQEQLEKEVLSNYVEFDDFFKEEPKPKKNTKLVPATEIKDADLKRTLYGAGAMGWTKEWYDKIVNSYKDDNLTITGCREEVNILLAQNKKEEDLTDLERLLLFAYAHPIRKLKVAYSPEHPAATYTRKTVNDCHMELTHYKDDIYINKDGYYVRVVERGRIV